ncbi:MAG: hypothetical protein HWE39_10105 [Oceanospirillaceae bacterium]|nr:hypothetical protein [Oceanospirillaceae bacterium]
MSDRELEEIKKDTMKILETTNPDDVAYITQELLDMEYDDESDFSEEKEGEKSVTVIYGHNMAYRTINGTQYYTYNRGNNPPTCANACGETGKRVPWNAWDHHSLTDRCSHGNTLHSLITKFVKR